MRFLVVLALAVGCLAAVKPSREYNGVATSVLYGEDKSYTLVPRDTSLAAEQFGDNEAAWGIFNDTISENGWSRLEMHTNPAFPDQLAAYAAGYLEGVFTSQRIWQSAVNNGVVGFSPDPTLAQFFQEWFEFSMTMQTLASQEPSTSPTRAYWWQVGLVMTQFSAIYRGYNDSALPGENTLNELDIFVLNAIDELGDIGLGLSMQGKNVGNYDLRGRSLKGQRAGHCSALVKLLDNNADLYITQITWSTLNSMLRVYKLYDFPFSTTGAPDAPTVPARRSSFSGYPGVVFSGDDFYVLSSGLVVQETTIGAENNQLFGEYISPETVPEFIRNVVANRLAASARQWTGLFALFNSGTYNNMMMILDYNLFTPGKPLQNDTFYICEQIPGFVRSTDLSMMVEQNRYFGSYNIPFDPMIRELSGVEDMVAMFGPWFTYWGHPRAQIFKRDQGNVASIDDLKTLMRYNNFKVDPLSSQMPMCDYLNMTTCHPPYSSENTIATRCDLNPADGVYAFPALGHRDHVATDAKISAYSLFDPNTCFAHVISGPTYDTQPPFQWSTSTYNNTGHVGMPDLWQFPWTTMSF